jgi:2-dehydro-3-deoxy-D-arabinonate dehydratase
MVTTDEITDPRGLHMSCCITRDGETIFSGEVSTSRIGRTMEILVEYLMRSNPVPAGSVLLTGTGIIVGEDAALAAGDSVTIRVEEIGELTNTAAVVG